MKRTALFMLLLLAPVCLFASLAPGTVCYLPLTSDTTDSGGLYTWDNVNSVTFELKDGFNSAKFQNSIGTQHIKTASAVTEEIKTVTFNIWIPTPNGNRADWRMYTVDAVNAFSIQYYNNTLFFYHSGGAGGNFAWSNIPEGEWVNMAVTWDATGNVTSCYVNNVIKGTTTSPASATGKVWYIANTSWALNQGADLWVRDFRLMSTVATSFPVTDPIESPTVSATITQTRTATPTVTPTVTPPVCRWERLTTSAGFAGRGFAGFTTYNNKLWIMGGGACDFGTCDQYNDVWSSPDGVNWTQVTASADFSARRRCVVWNFNNYMYLAGGIDAVGTYLKDVWRSSNGADWELVTGNAQWGDASIVGGSGGRIPAVYNGVVFDNKMWILTGQVQDLGCVADCWNSTNGADWYATTRNAEFIGRSGGAGTVHNGFMYISGGATCFGGTSQVCYKSSDGIVWTQTDDISAGHMQHHGMFSYKNYVWVSGGATGNPGVDVNTVIFSTAGTSWKTGVGGYVPTRGAYCHGILNGRMVIYAGYENENLGQTSVTPLSDVWASYACDPIYFDGVIYYTSNSYVQ